MKKVYTKKEIIEAMRNVYKHYCGINNEINYGDDFIRGVIFAIERMQFELDFPKENILEDLWR